MHQLCPMCTKHPGLPQDAPEDPGKEPGLLRAAQHSQSSASPRNLMPDAASPHHREKPQTNNKENTHGHRKCPVPASLSYWRNAGG